LAKLLGKALLWCIFSEHKEWVPPALRDHVTMAYQELVPVPARAGVVLPIVDNPISKTALVITGEDAVVHLTEVGTILDQGHGGQGDHDNGAEAGQAGGNLQALSIRQLLQTLLAQQGTLQHQITIAKQQREVERAADRIAMRNLTRIISENFRRLAQNPVLLMNRHNAPPINHRQEENVDDGNGNRPLVDMENPPVRRPPLLVADLSSCPRTLQELWIEYELGLGGRKAARLFTAQERGRVKHKYTRRKHVWDLIKLLIRTGLSYQTACDRIYNVYGQATTVTTIINRINHDKKSGTLHPDLRVTD